MKIQNNIKRLDIMKNNKIKLFVFCVIVLFTLSCTGGGPTEPEPIEPIIIEKPIKTGND